MTQWHGFFLPVTASEQSNTKSVTAFINFPETPARAFLTMGFSRDASLERWFGGRASNVPF
jgi:hypothetical protein